MAPKASQNVSLPERTVHIREHNGEYGLFAQTVLVATSESPIALSDYAFNKNKFVVVHDYDLKKAQGKIRQARVKEL